MSLRDKAYLTAVRMNNRYTIGILLSGNPEIHMEYYLITINMD